MLQAIIYATHGGYCLDDNSQDQVLLPGFIKSYICKDEYEANLLYATWMQYSKDMGNNAEYNKFQWIWKAVITLIGRESAWSLHT